MSYLSSQIDFADKFSDLISDLSKWSQATFGSDSERGPMGALKHLEKEARECQEAVGTAELPEELADCFLLLLDASRRAGIKPMRLVEVAQGKMEKNKKRTWPKPTSDNPVEHERDWEIEFVDEQSGICRSSSCVVRASNNDDARRKVSEKGPGIFVTSCMAPKPE